MADFVASLERPRKVVIMVKAGGPTDAVIAELVPLLEAGDIVIDAGNAHFPDTVRRESELKAHGLHFVGSGVSGALTKVTKRASLSTIFGSSTTRPKPKIRWSCSARSG